MNGLEKITGRIAGDAKADAAAVLKEAEERCQAITSDYEKKANAQYDRLIKEGQAECEALYRRMVSSAEMEGRKKILGIKQEAVSKVLEFAKVRLAAMEKEDYIPFLAKLAAEASLTGEEELILNARDRAAVGEELCADANRLLEKAGKKASLTLSAERGGFTGGFLLREGKIEVDCTVETLVELSRGTLASQIARTLFPYELR